MPFTPAALLVLWFAIVVVAALVVWAMHPVEVVDHRLKPIFINLDRNTDRRDHFYNQVKHTDVADLVVVEGIQRFSAVDGRGIRNLLQHVTKEAYMQIVETERTRYRKRHSDLTRGGVGCFLSHAAVAKQLLEEPDDGSSLCYLVFEDDACIDEKVVSKVRHALARVPDDWDMLVLGDCYSTVSWTNRDLKKYKTWWGMYGYVVNRQGARKILDTYVRDKIDKQIDSALSKLCTDGNMHVYGLTTPAVWANDSFSTNIQTPVADIPGIDAFELT